MTDSTTSPIVLKDQEGREWTLTPPTPVLPVFKAGDVPARVLKSSESEVVIYGPASVEIVDQEGDLISGEALNKALPQLLRRARFSLQHFDILPGEILPSFKMDDGSDINTEVRPVTKADLDMFTWLVGKGVKEGDLSLFCVGKVWSDTSFSRETQDSILKGELNSFSISGQATAQGRRMVSDGFTYKVVNEITGIDLSAVTICKEGMNQAAKFVILKKEFVGKESFKLDDGGLNHIDGSCSCPLHKQEQEANERETSTEVKKAVNMDKKLKSIEMDMRIADLEATMMKANPVARNQDKSIDLRIKLAERSLAKSDPVNMKIAALEQQVTKYWVPDGMSANGQPKAYNPGTGRTLYGDAATRALQNQPVSEFGEATDFPGGPEQEEASRRGLQRLDNTDLARGMAQRNAREAQAALQEEQRQQGGNVMDSPLAPEWAGVDEMSNQRRSDYDTFRQVNEYNDPNAKAELFAADNDDAANGYERFANMRGTETDNMADDILNMTGNFGTHPADMGVDNTLDRLAEGYDDAEIEDVAMGPADFEDENGNYIENPSYGAIAGSTWGKVENGIESMIEEDTTDEESEADGAMDPDIWDSDGENEPEDMDDEEYNTRGPGNLKKQKAMPFKDAIEKPLKLGNPAHPAGSSVYVNHNSDGPMKKPENLDLIEYPAGSDRTKDSANDDIATGTRPRGFYQKSPLLAAAGRATLMGGAEAAGAGAVSSMMEDTGSEKTIGCTCNHGMGMHSKECPAFTEAMPRGDDLVQKPMPGPEMPQEAPPGPAAALEGAPPAAPPPQHPEGEEEHKKQFALMGKAHIDAQCIECRRISKRYDGIDRYFAVIKEALATGTVRHGFLSVRDRMTLRKELPTFQADGKLLSLIQKEREN